MVKQRIRKDLILLSISMFAIVGSIFVLQSFAQQRINSKIPGVLPISSLEINNQNITMLVNLSTRKGLTYCVPALFNSSNYTPYIKLSNGETSNLLFSNNTYCYASPEDNEVVLYIPTLYLDQNITITE